MPIIGTVYPQPNDVEDYDIDFGEYFPLDDTIVSAVISCTPEMPVPPSFAMRAITNDGREKEAELVVKCREV